MMRGEDAPWSSSRSEGSEQAESLRRPSCPGGIAEGSLALGAVSEALEVRVREGILDPRLPVLRNRNRRRGDDPAEVPEPGSETRPGPIHCSRDEARS